MTSHSAYGTTGSSFVEDPLNADMMAFQGSGHGCTTLSNDGKGFSDTTKSTMLVVTPSIGTQKTSCTRGSKASRAEEREYAYTVKAGKSSECAGRFEHGGDPL